MILYARENWFEVIFTYVGTVWPQIRVKFWLATLYSTIAYVLCEEKGNIGSEGRTILFGTMSFLLIFRANQAYSRYWVGRTMVTGFFSDLREIIMISLIYIKGGVCTSTFLFHGGPGIPPKWMIPEDAFDKMAREMRVDIVRLSIALAVAYKLHTRVAHDGYCFGHITKEVKWCVDFDRFRLRLLLSGEEFGIVDGLLGVAEPEAVSPEELLDHLCEQFRIGHDEGGSREPPDSWPAEFEVNHGCAVRLPVAIIYLLREVLFRSMNGPLNNQPWGIKERFLVGLETLLLAMQHSFEMTHQIITTPVPLPYANLCKTLLLIFLLSLPFFVDYKLGWFANTVIPALISLALLGIDAIATELENPFGDDDNDLELLESINVLEREAMEMMRLAGDVEGCGRFCWRELPDFVKARSCRAVRRQLAVRELAAAVPGKDLGPGAGGGRRPGSKKPSGRRQAHGQSPSGVMPLEISG
mmetsp:Transcript_59426/g.173904  ORF Transcript_59426/g.173904 Transcript_59426/m.173904 type:complete len:470 (+) Transcript_59426:197-1606(+)